MSYFNCVFQKGDDVVVPKIIIWVDSPELFMVLCYKEAPNFLRKMLMWI